MVKCNEILFCTSYRFDFGVLSAGLYQEVGKIPVDGQKIITAIKGFSILTVVWAHSGAMLLLEEFSSLLELAWHCFLMCSGYGLEISYREKNGLEEFWKKRLLSVCLPFWVVELVGLFCC